MSPGDSLTSYGSLDSYLCDCSTFPSVSQACQAKLHLCWEWTECAKTCVSFWLYLYHLSENHIWGVIYWYPHVSSGVRDTGVTLRLSSESCISPALPWGLGQGGPFIHLFNNHYVYYYTAWDAKTDPNQDHAWESVQPRKWIIIFQSRRRLVDIWIVSGSLEQAEMISTRGVMEGLRMKRDLGHSSILQQDSANSPSIRIHKT